MKYKGGFLYKKEEELTSTDIVARWILQNTGLLEKHERLYEAIEHWYEMDNEIEMTDEEREEWERWDYRLKEYSYKRTMNIELLDKTDEENYLGVSNNRFLVEWSEEERQWQNYFSTEGQGFKLTALRGTLGVQRWNLRLKIRKGVNTNEYCWMDIMATKWINYIDFIAWSESYGFNEGEVSIEEIDDKTMKRIERSLILFAIKGH